MTIACVDDLPKVASDNMKIVYNKQGEDVTATFQRIVSEIAPAVLMVCDDCEGSGRCCMYDACLTCSGDGIVALAPDGFLFNPFEGDR